MYVCMYVCMRARVCVYVCMYVCKLYAELHMGCLNASVCEEGKSEQYDNLF
jgi:hypothetical protein